MNISEKTLELKIKEREKARARTNPTMFERPSTTTVRCASGILYRSSSSRHALGVHGMLVHWKDADDEDDDDDEDDGEESEETEEDEADGTTCVCDIDDDDNDDDADDSSGDDNDDDDDDDDSGSGNAARGGRGGNVDRCSHGSNWPARRSARQPKLNGWKPSTSLCTAIAFRMRACVGV